MLALWLPIVLTAVAGLVVLLIWFWRVMGDEPPPPARLCISALVFVLFGAGWVWFVKDWFDSGCSDTPNCGWEAGFWVLPSVWLALVALAAYWNTRKSAAGGDASELASTE